MGARTLRAYVEQPLIDKAEIELRQEAIGELNDHVITREELREYLNPIYDLERLITRVTYRTANPRDLIAFKNSISMLPPIKSLLDEFDGALLKISRMILIPWRNCVHSLIIRSWKSLRYLCVRVV